MMSDSIGVCSQKALEWKQLLSDGKDPQSVGDHPSAEERQKDFQLYLNLYITNTAEDSAISWQSECKLKMPKDSLVGTTASRQITPQSSTNRRKHIECLIKNKNCTVSLCIYYLWLQSLILQASQSNCKCWHPTLWNPTIKHPMLASLMLSDLHQK